jgi:hypothetical protein
MHPSVRVDALIPSLPSPSPPLPSPPLPSPADTVCCPRGQAMSARTRYVRADTDADARKVGKKFRFSVFNPQDPWASWVKPQEKEGFFGLVPLVTHPSSIPLLGGLTPKFLSLSLHSL